MNTESRGCVRDVRRQYKLLYLVGTAKGEDRQG